MLSLRLWSAALLTLGALAACSPVEEATSALDPKGHGAAQIADLWWFMLITATIVYVVVMSLLAINLFRRRREEPDLTAPPSPRSHLFILIGGAAIPAVILAVLFVLTLNTILNLSPARAGEPLTIEVTGRMWWWEVRYPDQDIVTANELHIPVGQPVRIELMAEEVIHSFWVPELHGKMDLIPGQTNIITIQADEPGAYRGRCAEFCGIQHARMAFYVVAHEAEEFDSWLTGQQQTAAEPQDDLARRGREVFLASNCVYCHTIRGTSAAGRVGPDLTHLAGRLTLGAGTVPNTRGHLAGWVVNAQSIKPGNHMPPVALSAEDLQALLAYLEMLF